MNRELYLPEERKGYKGNRKTKTIICLAVSIFLAALLTGSIVRGQQVQAKMEQTQQHLAEEVFRFHVLANSDSEEDQALKMKVKERVIAYMKEQLPEAESAEDTKAWARANLDSLEKVSKEVIRQNGYSYDARAEVAYCDFPDKTYGDVTFPAGEYEALRIEIGKGNGRNWWCVLYPNLCFVDSVHAVVPEKGKDALRQVLEEEEYEMVTATSDFKIKWFFFGDEK